MTDLKRIQLIGWVVILEHFIWTLQFQLSKNIFLEFREILQSQTGIDNFWHI